MGTIVAIGGGEIGRPGYPVETTTIDRHIIELAKKRRPRLLFIPTASHDSQGYCDVVEQHFGERLGCQVNHLRLYGNADDPRDILKTDIIYVGGGNTLSMMRLWRKHGIDELLKKAYKKGIILSGLSAGANCWFTQCVSDSWKMRDPKKPYIRVHGIGLIDGLFCPHLDAEEGRREAMQKILQRTPGIGYAADNCAAIVFQDENVYSVTSKSTAHAYLLKANKITTLR